MSGYCQVIVRLCQVMSGYVRSEGSYELMLLTVQRDRKNTKNENSDQRDLTSSCVCAFCVHMIRKCAELYTHRPIEKTKQNDGNTRRHIKPSHSGPRCSTRWYRLANSSANVLDCTFTNQSEGLEFSPPRTMPIKVVFDATLSEE
jgi:hypothetical protein